MWWTSWVPLDHLRMATCFRETREEKVALQVFDYVIRQEGGKGMGRASWYAQDWMFRAANGTVRRRMFSSWGPDACENEGAQPAGRWEPLSPRWWQALRCQPGVSWTAPKNDSSWKPHSGPKARRGGHRLPPNDCTLTQIHWRTLEEVFRSFLPLKE